MEATVPLAIGGNTFSFMWSHPALEAMDRLNTLGLSAFDVIVTPGHLWPTEIDSAGRAELRKTLEARGYTLDSLNPPATDYNLASLTPDVRRLAMGMYGDIIDLAAELGAKGVIVVPGRVSSLLPPPSDQLRSVLEDGIGELADRARSRGIILHLEVHPLTPVPTTRDILGLVEGIASPSVGIAYDVANAEFVGENQADAIAAMGQHLTQLHLSDATRTRWMHGGFGTGTVDLKSVLDALEGSNFSGSAILEIISSDPLEDFKESLERIAAACTGTI
jgi:sugar phosphate isomerase/epimerase